MVFSEPAVENLTSALLDPLRVLNEVPTLDAGSRREFGDGPGKSLCCSLWEALEGRAASGPAPNRSLLAGGGGGAVVGT